MSDHRASRRTPDECRDILRTIKRGEDGKPLPGETKRVARNAGVSTATIRSWVARLGWPEDSAVAEAERRAERRQSRSVATHPPRALQRIDTSGAEPLPEPPQSGNSRPPGVRCNAPDPSVATHHLSPKMAVLARMVARGETYSEVARTVGLSRPTVRKYATEPGPVVDLIGELRAVDRRQIQQMGAHVVVQSMRATLASYDIAADIFREYVEAQEVLLAFDSENPMLDEDGNPQPLDADGLRHRMMLIERVDALRLQHTMVLNKSEAARKTTHQTIGILDGGLTGALGDEDGNDPLGAVDELDEDALDALAESALRRMQGG